MKKETKWVIASISIWVLFVLTIPFWVDTICYYEKEESTFKCVEFCSEKGLEFAEISIDWDCGFADCICINEEKIPVRLNADNGKYR